MEKLEQNILKKNEYLSKVELKEHRIGKSENFQKSAKFLYFPVDKDVIWVVRIQVIVFINPDNNNEKN